VQSAEGRARLVERMSEGNKEKTLAAPAGAVLALDSRFHEHVSTVMPFMPQLEEVFEENDDARVSAARLNSAPGRLFRVCRARAGARGRPDEWIRCGCRVRVSANQRGDCSSASGLITQV
jgi:hypothetical protein